MIKIIRNLSVFNPEYVLACTYWMAESCCLRLSESEIADYFSEK